MDVMTSIIIVGSTAMAILMSAYHFRQMKHLEHDATLAYDDRDRMSDLLHEERKSNQKLAEKLKLGIEDQDRLKDEVENLNKVIANLKSDLEKSRTSVDYRLTLIKDQASSIKHQVAVIHRLEADIDSLNNTIKELQDKDERDKKHFEETCQMLNDFGKEINRLNEVNAELDKFVVDLKQDNASLRYRLSTAESQRDDLARRLGETTAINTNLKELAIHCQNFLSVWREETDKAFSTLQNHVKQGLESQLITTNEPVQQSQENVDATQQGI